MELSNMYRLLFTTSLILTLAGCEMAGEAKNMTSGETEAFSCDQIRTAFAAYDADRTSFDALAELSGMTGYDFTRNATQTADTYYEKARNSANLALIVKGCDPL
jgi:hypothetical protein